MIIGIDATNINSGGGLTHLVGILNNYNSKHKIILWAPKKTLLHINSSRHIYKVHYKIFEKNYYLRYLWIYSNLDKELKKHRCDILFSPGGSLISNFKPSITISRNMLPFIYKELFRFGFSFTTLKLLMLNFFQKISFKKANGLIFLNEFASNFFHNKNYSIPKYFKIIPHGVNEIFRNNNKIYKDISSYNFNDPFEIVYLSKIDLYKHQWNVIDAIGSLILNKKLPIRLTLIGSTNAFTHKKLQNCLKKWPDSENWLKLTGDLDTQSIFDILSKSDLGVYASTCENLPNILLEKMVSSLPIACSNIQPMTDMLKHNAKYFDAEDSSSIYDAIYSLILDRQFREKSSKENYNSLLNYSWNKTSKDTFNFIEFIKSNYNE